MNEEELVQLITREVLARVREGADPRKLLPVNISARHVHLSPRDLAALFGPDYALTKLKDLLQPGQFAAQETVTVSGPRGRFHQVRILGPARGDSQVEVSLTDARVLGLEVPIRLSGNVAGTPGITLEGPQGRVTLSRGLIVAARHIHLGTEDAARFGVTQGQRVRVHTTGARPLTFDDVLVRVGAKFVPEMHVDTDEGNAAGLRNGELVEIVG